MFRAGAAGTGSALALLASYFTLLPLTAGWPYTFEQFGRYWAFIIALAAGFGIQLAFYVYLRRLVRVCPAQGKVVAVSGTASTAAMASCCTHYLANALPVVAATRVFGLAAQYQVGFFWVGLAVNAAGIAYIGSKLVVATRERTRCVVRAETVTAVRAAAPFGKLSS
jgi:P-type Cu+ transporter